MGGSSDFMGVASCHVVRTVKQPYEEGPHGEKLLSPSDGPRPPPCWTWILRPQSGPSGTPSQEQPTTLLLNFWPTNVWWLKLLFWANVLPKVQLTCSRPPVCPTWFRWFLSSCLGSLDVSRANRSTEKNGTSFPFSLSSYSSMALFSIKNFTASYRLYSSSSLVNSLSQATCLASAVLSSAKPAHYNKKGTWELCFCSKSLWYTSIIWAQNNFQK